MLCCSLTHAGPQATIVRQEYLFISVPSVTIAISTLRHTTTTKTLCGYESIAKGACNSVQKLLINQSKVTTATEQDQLLSGGISLASERASVASRKHSAIKQKQYYYLYASHTHTSSPKRRQSFVVTARAITRLESGKEESSY